MTAPKETEAKVGGEKRSSIDAEINRNLANRNWDLNTKLEKATAALRDILGYCDEKPEDCRIYEHMVAREYFAKHGEKGRG